MRRWILTLGDFEASWGKLLLAEWDGATLRCNELLTYSFPADRRVHGKGFTGACMHRGRLLVCGFNGVFEVDLARLRVEAAIVRDDFNDLHDVAISGVPGAEQIVVANTGHDRVERFTLEGQPLGSMKLVPSAAWNADDPADPYFDQRNQPDQPERPVHLTRLQDRVHPNSVLPVGDRVLVSRFAERSIGWAGGAQIGTPGCTHDLYLADGRLWATTTRGEVCAWRWLDDAPHGQPTCVDSFARTGRSGWCRGLDVSDDLILLGMTRITRMPRVRWCDRPFDRTGTGLLIMDRATHREVAYHDLSMFGSHPKIFSIVPLTTPSFDEKP